MKNRKITLLAIAALLTGGSAMAQMKVGGTAAPDASSMLEVNSIGNKGLRLPRVSLTSTTTFSLTAPTVADSARGMLVYNTNAAITSSNTSYPAAGVGAYVWDGTGWSHSKVAAAANTNIYNADGTLTGARIVTQGSNDLTFSGPGILQKSSTVAGAAPATSGTEQSAGQLMRLADNSAAIMDIGAGGPSLGYAYYLQTGRTTSLATTYPLLLNPNGGSVGIGTGTAIPASRLDVRSGNYLLAKFADTSGVGAHIELGVKKASATSPYYGAVMDYIDSANYQNSFRANAFEVRATGSNRDGRLNFFGGNSAGSISASSIPDLTVAANGRVGINVGAPSAILDVNTIDSIGVLVRSGNTATAYNNSQLSFGYYGTNQYRHNLSTRHNASGEGGNAFDFNLWTPATAGNINYNASKTVMTLNGNGYVGFGSTNPAYRIYVLDSAGNGGSGDDIMFDSYTGTGVSAPGFYQRHSRGTLSAPDNLVNGDLILHMEGDGRANNAIRRLSYMYGYYTGSGTSYSSDLRFGTTGVERMRIDSVGNVGIGTITPTNDLTIAQTIGGQGIALIGRAVDNSVDATSGVVQVLGHNSAGNRQIWQGDKSALGFTKGAFTRTVVAYDAATQNQQQVVTLDAVNGTGSNRTTLHLGTRNGSASSWSRVVIGAGTVNDSIPPASFFHVNGEQSIGTNWRGYAAPSNGLLVQGNVGIGDTLPVQKLTVAGTIKAGPIDGGSAMISPGGAANAGFLSIYKGNGTTRLAYIGYNNDDLTYVTENGADHAFIGSDNLDTVGRFVANNQTQGIEFGYQTIRKNATAANSPMYLNAKGTGDLILHNESTGNVGIGTTTTAAKLDVAGTFKLGTSGTAINAIIKGTGTTSSANTLTAASTTVINFAVANTLAVGSTVSVSPTANLASGVAIAYARVSANGTVTIGLLNATATAVSLPTASAFNIVVTQ